jgi:uncharacterized membrane protein YfcA
MEKDIIFLLVGVVVGAMNAIAGGGMLVGFPVLVALGVPPLVANATGGVITAPGQLSSAIGYWRYLRKVPLRYIWLLIPVVIGAFCGANVLRHTSADRFAQIVPALVLFGVVLFAFQPLMHFHLHRELKGRYKTILPLVILGLAILPISFYGGYFGAGYGFLMLAFLGFTNLPDTHTINAMKNVSAIFLSTTAIICLLCTHLINWRVGLVMGAGSTIGGFLGARGAQKVSSHWLRIGIIIIGLMAVVYLGFQEY